MVVQAIFASILSCASATQAAPPKDYVPDIPANHWIFQDLQRLGDDGLILYRPNRFSSGPPQNRWNITISVHAAYARVVTAANELERQAGRPAFQLEDADRAFGPNAIGSLNKPQKNAPAWRPILDALITEFSRELQFLGVNTSEMKHRMHYSIARIESFHPAIDKPFIDVPNAHWAASQIQDLKSLGLIAGDGQGRFDGNGP